MNVRRTAALAASAAALSSLTLLAPAAHASGNDRLVSAGGPCATGVWELKAKPDDGRLEVEFEIDTNRAGQTWAVKVKDNGTNVFSGQRTTGGRSGSFSLEFRTANRAGTDHIKATATRGGTTCSGSVNL